jgi:diguanylate cyclase (GGDEF)-like protein/PAS domain S-box-containing protein
MDPKRKPLIALVAIGVGYFLLAAGAILMTRLDGGVALLWLANAPLIGALCASPHRRWPAIAAAAWIGSMAASVLTSPIPMAAPLFASINIGEAVFAAFLLQRWGVMRTLFNSVGSIGLFVVGAGIAAPIASGVAGAWAASNFLPVHFMPALFDWLIGHGIGNLIGAPFAMLATRKDIDWQRFHAQRGVPAAIGTAILVAASTAVIFGQSGLPLLFLTIVPVLAATFAFERFGASISIIIVAVVGGLFTTHGLGPIMLIHGGGAAQLQFFQFYLAVLFLLALPVAATLMQRDKLMSALGVSEARYRLLADNASDIMLTLDPDGTIRFASPSIREIGHFDPDLLIGRNALALVHVEERDRVRDAHLKALAAPDRTFTVEYRGIKANGESSWFESNMRAVRGADGTIIAAVSVIRDLGVRKKREAELERAASTDPLTGLLNRTSFRQRVDEAIARTNQPATLAILDLDYFKRVNDSFGHATGDAALLTLADLLRENLRIEDAVGRIGGEEFAILLAGLPLATAATICDRLRLALAACMIPIAGGGATSITMSIGLTPVSPAKTVDEIFAEADAALYAAKANGRNRTEIAAI